ncbi:MAG TPA: hypothetical protein PKE19_00090 [Aestuariivirga sp.]|nr:hypothetical protein [Aestuariivirga sp.]
MSRWFRHYGGMMRDSKLVAVAVKTKQPIERVLWVWGAILESASETDDAGRYEFDAAETAYFLRTDESDIRAIEDGLVAAGRLDSSRVVMWGERQFQSDGSKVRQAALRERKRSIGGGVYNQHRGKTVTEPSRDADVTSPRRDVTSPDTDTEADTEKKERDVVSALAETSVAPNSKPKLRRKPAYTPEFEKFFDGFPGREGTSKAEAWEVWVTLPPEDQKAASDALSAFVAWCGKQKPDYRPLHACRYLKYRRWETLASTSTSPPVVQVPVLAGTEAFRAWERHNGRSLPTTTIRDPTTQAVIGTGWYFPSEFPPERQGLAA